MRQFFLIFILFSFWSCKENEPVKVAEASTEVRFINPPLQSEEIAFQVNSLEASSGKVLQYPSGSFIYFPPDAFVDGSGKVIKGNVEVKFREFRNPVDFYFSGIPMGYDSSGKAYRLESSGMCEILAYKDGEPVFVNPKSQPQVNLISTNTDIRNLYFLDTVKRSWVYIGQSGLTESKISSKQRAGETEADYYNIIEGVPETERVRDRDLDEVVTEPVKPGRVDNSAPVFEILIDSNSFLELAVYHNLKFQLTTGNQEINPKDVEMEWSDVEVSKGKKKGLYIIKFSNNQKTVSYEARPVLEGKDYDQAIKDFELARKKYENWKEDQLARQRDLQRGLIRNSENKTKKIKSFIEKKNKEIDQDNSVVEEVNKAFSTFPINRLGIYNCDRPFLQFLFPVDAIFTNEKNQTIELEDIGVVSKTYNSIMAFPDKRIQLIKGSEHMIVGQTNGSFAYFTYEDYKKYNEERKLKSASNPYIFKMRIIPKMDSYYAELKKIAEEE